MITKKLLKKIGKGDHDALIEAVEYLLDHYEEDKFDQGYNSCVADLSVHAQILADEIWKLHGERSPDKPFNKPNLNKVIEDYFNTILNE